MGRGGVVVQRVFCFLGNFMPFFSPSPSVRRAECQSHSGLDEKHKTTAAVIQTDASLRQRRNGDEEDVQKIGHASDQRTTLEVSNVTGWASFLSLKPPLPPSLSHTLNRDSIL